jgi:hypothetical protein
VTIRNIAQNVKFLRGAFFLRRVRPNGYPEVTTCFSQRPTVRNPNPLPRTAVNRTARFAPNRRTSVSMGLRRKG